MTQVVNFFKVLRSHWKKSLLGSAALTYGFKYAKDEFQTEQIMREFCEEAVKYGDYSISPTVQPTHMTIILNPVAKKRKAKKLFEKYCEPLLHLAGVAITIIQTESESQARSIVANLNSRTDAIIVAGGDGTLADVVTGLMRKCQSNLAIVKQCPIGILPLGQKNRIADSLYDNNEKKDLVRALGGATMAIIKGNTKLLDAVEVAPLENNPENSVKAAYALGAIEWGAWKDANSRADKYWYWGSLKEYVTYVFNGHKKDLNWNCNATIRYSYPCDGCSHCFEQQKSVNENLSGKRWWHVFVPRPKTLSNDSRSIDYSKVKNENCGIFKEVSVSSAELQIMTNNIQKEDRESLSEVKIGLVRKPVSYTEFVTEGWKRLSGKTGLMEDILKAKDIELYPGEDEAFRDKSRMFYIDSEEFELKPVKIKLLPRSVKVFCMQNRS